MYISEGMGDKYELVFYLLFNCRAEDLFFFVSFPGDKFLLQKAERRLYIERALPDYVVNATYYSFGQIEYLGSSGGSSQIYYYCVDGIASREDKKLCQI